MLEKHNAVGNALHLEITVGRSQVIKEHHRAMAAGKKLLESENLAAIAKRVSGQEA